MYTRVRWISFNKSSQTNTICKNLVFQFQFVSLAVAFVFGSMCAAPAAEKAFKYEVFFHKGKEGTLAKQ